MGAFELSAAAELFLQEKQVNDKLVGGVLPALATFIATAPAAAPDTAGHSRRVVGGAELRLLLVPYTDLLQQQARFLARFLAISSAPRMRPWPAPPPPRRFFSSSCDRPPF